MQRVEVKESVRDFFDRYPDARKREVEMVKVLQSRPHLVNDLDAVYAITYQNSSDEIKQEGRKEALKSLAQNQQAAVPKGNATNQAQMSAANRVTPNNVHELVAKNDHNWFVKNYDAINKALAAQ